MIGHRQIFLAEFKDRVFLRFDLLIAVIEVDADPGIDKENPEDIKDFVKLLNEKCANKNKDAPENNGTQNSPEKDLVIVGLVDLEIFKDKEDDKNIIDRQGIFGEVCREILYCSLRPAFIIYEDKYPEQGRYHHPKNRLVEGRPGADLARLFVEKAKVQNQEENDDYSENSEKYYLFRRKATEERKGEYVKHLAQRGLY